VLVCRFRRLAMKHHPDIESAETSQQEFARICEAYEVLSSGESAVLGADTA
jgi:DnaJ-class molecular chaperone